MFVAESWLAYDLTGSPLYLGYVGVAAAVPAIVLNLVGGVVADRVDKRMLILLGQVVMTVVIGLLGVLTITGNHRGLAPDNVGVHNRGVRGVRAARTGGAVSAPDRAQGDGERGRAGLGGLGRGRASERPRWRG